jgi:thiamine kinase-like enzyme
LSVETAFTEEQDRILLEAYLGRPPRESEYGRIVLYKSLAFLLWTLWGVLQHVNENPRPAYHFANYWDYAMDRFTKCQAIMNSDRFATLLEAVRLRA